MNIILIPYRDRQDHLNYFIKNTLPILQKYLNPLKIIIIEQNNVMIIAEIKSRAFIIYPKPTIQIKKALKPNEYLACVVIISNKSKIN